MPTNVYGHKDKFDKVNGHVIPAIITKVEQAKKIKKLELLGTGKPLREFIHADDLASAILFNLQINKRKIKKYFITNCR